MSTDSEFYAGAPTEQPLYRNRTTLDSRHIRETGRHKAIADRRKETIDPREKAALLAIFKSAFMILLLLIAFLLLWKGINLYENNVWMDAQKETGVSPIMHEVGLIDEFDVQDQDAREMFEERVEIWKEADRLVRSSDALLSRNNYDQAILRCQEALQRDSFHVGALERLGKLYFVKELHVQSINSYMRLLNIDPSRADFLEKLIQVLDAYGDSKAIIYLAQWYFEQNHYDRDVQYYMANALFDQKEYARAVVAYDRVLQDSPRDSLALEKQATAFIYLEQYEEALFLLKILREIDYKNQSYCKQIVICNAQLGNAEETVQMLGRSAHLFGQNTIVGWIQDPQLDPVREDRSFQSFADRMGGEEFRKWLEKVAETTDNNQKNVKPLLKMPTSGLDNELLKARK